MYELFLKSSSSTISSQVPQLVRVDIDLKPSQNSETKIMDFSYMLGLTEMFTIWRIPETFFVINPELWWEVVRGISELAASLDQFPTWVWIFLPKCIGLSDCAKAVFESPSSQSKVTWCRYLGSVDGIVLTWMWLCNKSTFTPWFFFFSCCLHCCFGCFHCRLYRCFVTLVAFVVPRDRRLLGVKRGEDEQLQDQQDAQQHRGGSSPRPD